MLYWESEESVPVPSVKVQAGGFQQGILQPLQPREPRCTARGSLSRRQAHVQPQDLPHAHTGSHPQSTAADGAAREPHTARRASPAWCRASRRQRGLLGEKAGQLGRLYPGGCHRITSLASPQPLETLKAIVGLRWLPMREQHPLPP